MRSLLSYAGGRKWLPGLTVSFLMLCSSGCADTPAPATLTKVEREYPASSLVLQTPAPLFRGRLNSDLLEYSEQLEDALKSCNADKASIERWTREGQQRDQ